MLIFDRLCELHFSNLSLYTAIKLTEVSVKLDLFVFAFAQRVYCISIGYSFHTSDTMRYAINSQT